MWWLVLCHSTHVGSDSGRQDVLMERPPLGGDISGVNAFTRTLGALAWARKTKGREQSLVASLATSALGERGWLVAFAGETPIIFQSAEELS
jgi:hypothetical protein